MKRWFEKFIGCAFYLGREVVSADLEGEYIFKGARPGYWHDAEFPDKEGVEHE